MSDLARAATGTLGTIDLLPEVTGEMGKSLALVQRAVAEGQRTYGVNTGFGPLSNTAIPAEKLAEMQRRMILSHCVGTGPLLDDATVRQILLLKINTLSLGYSGVRPELVMALIHLYSAGIYPCIPAKGSVGASGDLAPLAHLTAALIGVGDVSVEGVIMPATEALKKAGLAPTALGPKEGLAMVNGTQVSLALALKGLFATESLLAAAIVAGAMSTDAAMGSDMPFDNRIQVVRGQRGQARIAPAYARLIAGSAIRDSHRNCDRVQDPYSLRCQPQVMGVVLDLLEFAGDMLRREINGVTDNPIVFAEDGTILYGGNFHGQPIAAAADVLALAIAEIGSMAERRIALLVDQNFSRLPPFLAVDAGVDSGFMLGQVAAAALASENKCLAHPASIDSLPTAAGQEDIVSMATYAARRLTDMAENAAAIVAIELLAAGQGIEFRRPLTTSPLLEEALAIIRAKVAPYTEDRFLKSDIDWVAATIMAGDFRRFVPLELMPSTA